MASAPGPDRRTTPIPAAPAAVAMATMVSAADRPGFALCMAPMLPGGPDRADPPGAFDQPLALAGLPGLSGPDDLGGSPL